MKHCLILILACALLGVPAWAQQPSAPVFRAGAATSNITPPLGLDLIGNFVPAPGTHIHDELHARCLVLDDGRTKLAIVVLDLLGIDRSVSDEARRLIKESSGIALGNVLICAVHTHSAPSALNLERYKISQPLTDYQKFVVARIADGVKCAANNLRPAQIAFVTAEAPEHLFNRRWYMKEGTMPPNPFGGVDKVKMNPPAGSADLLEPAGPTDPTISILALREPAGRPIAVFSTYSLHYVGGVGPGHVSADYYGMFCRQLERLLKAEDLDPPFVPMMANGTSGDVNNISFRQPRPRQGAYQQMRAVADDVAAKVYAALLKAEYRDHAVLAARYRELSVKGRHPTAEQLDWARRTLAEPAPAGFSLPRLYADRTIQLAEQPQTLPLPLQILRIGDACIGTMPNEIFCETGLDFRKRSPLQSAFLVSLAHGYYGYLPTPRHHELGGYETWLGTSRLEPQASEKMLEALLEMAGEVKGDAR